MALERALPTKDFEAEFETTGIQLTSEEFSTAMLLFFSHLAGNSEHDIRRLDNEIAEAVTRRIKFLRSEDPQQQHERQASRMAEAGTHLQRIVKKVSWSNLRGRDDEASLSTPQHSLPHDPTRSTFEAQTPDQRTPQLPDSSKTSSHSADMSDLDLSRSVPRTWSRGVSPHSTTSQSDSFTVASHRRLPSSRASEAHTDRSQLSQGSSASFFVCQPVLEPPKLKRRTTRAALAARALSRALMYDSTDFINSLASQPTEQPGVMDTNFRLESEPPRPRIRAIGVSPITSARIAVAKAFNSTPLQVMVVLLVIIDAITLGLEAILLVSPCKLPSACGIDSHHKGGEDEFGPAYCASKFGEICGRVHSAEYTLKWISKSILMFFMGQIFLMLVVLRGHFFRQPFFVLDFVVVGVALALEFLSFNGGGIIVFVLLWRLLRVAHALATTFDVHHHAVKTKIIKVQKKDILSQKPIHKRIQQHRRQSDALLAAHDAQPEYTSQSLQVLSGEELKRILLQERSRARETEGHFMSLSGMLGDIHEHIEQKKKAFWSQQEKRYFPTEAHNWSRSEMSFEAQPSGKAPQSQRDPDLTNANKPFTMQQQACALAEEVLDEEWERESSSIDRILDDDESVGGLADGSSVHSEFADLVYD
eukprot:c25376_g1_i1.p1 GENE.c25376_g1_i1~~c25376_g1_i1.p1  ORF type:complete len:746 (-),score=157.99 c25376_g1_i1:116-2056(-)